MKPALIFIGILICKTAIAANSDCSNTYFPTISGTNLTYSFVTVLQPVTKNSEKQTLNRFITRTSVNNFVEKISLDGKTLVTNSWECNKSALVNKNYLDNMKNHQSVINLLLILPQDRQFISQDQWKINQQLNSTSGFSTNFLSGSIQRDKKIVAFEKIKIGLDTFESIKIEEKINLMTKNMFGKQITNIFMTDWYVKNIGLVKRIAKTNNLIVKIELKSFEQLI